MLSQKEDYYYHGSDPDVVWRRSIPRRYLWCRSKTGVAAQTGFLLLLLLLLFWCYRKIDNNTEMFLGVVGRPVIPQKYFWCRTKTINNAIFLRSQKDQSGFRHYMLTKFRTGALQWGAAETEIKVPSGENTERKRSPFKAWGRWAYGHTCFA